TAGSQTLTVLGSQFQNGLKVMVVLPAGGGSSTLSGSQIQGGMSTSFQMSTILNAAGTYGFLGVNSDGGQYGTFSFALSAATPSPTVDPNRVALNSASFSKGPVAAGSLVSIFGSNFATGNALAQSIPLPSSLSNVSVTFNGIPAPVSGVFHDAVNGDQIN